MNFHNHIIRFIWVFFAVLLMSCGSAETNPRSEIPSIDPWEDAGPQPPPERIDKETLGSPAKCDNWRETIADEIAETPPWGLPQTGIVSENINAFFATQHPINGVNYHRCVLADIFSEIPLHVEVLREAYFRLAPEEQLARSQLALFFLYLYEEPLTIPLVLDIAVQPIPEFSSEYIEWAGLPHIMEGEADVRVAAVMAISDSAPYQGDREVWIDALFEVVARCEVGNVPLIATWQLKNKGITPAEFEERMQPRLSAQDLAYLLEHGWQ